MESLEDCFIVVCFQGVEKMQPLQRCGEFDLVDLNLEHAAAGFSPVPITALTFCGTHRSPTLALKAEYFNEGERIACHLGFPSKCNPDGLSGDRQFDQIAGGEIIVGDVGRRLGFRFANPENRRATSPSR